MDSISTNCRNRPISSLEPREILNLLRIGLETKTNDLVSPEFVQRFRYLFALNKDPDLTWLRGAGDDAI